MKDNYIILRGKASNVAHQSYGEDEKLHIVNFDLDKHRIEANQFGPLELNENDEIVAAVRPYGKVYRAISLYNKTLGISKTNFAYIYFILGIAATFIGGLLSAWAYEEIITYGWIESIPEILMPSVLLPIGLLLLRASFHDFIAGKLVQKNSD